MKIDKNLLIEIGTEELPSDQLLNLSNSFTQNFIKIIKKNKIEYKKIKQFYTPKRISIIIYNLSQYTKKKKLIIKGPEKNLSNESLMINFIKDNNIKINNLKTIIYKKKEYYIYEKYIKEKNLAIILPQIIKNSIYEMHIHKKMKWETVSKPFVRPIKWLSIILNTKNIFLQIFNIKSNTFSNGHSSLHNKKLLINPFFYEKILENYGKIIPCNNKRTTIIQNSLKKILKNTNIFFEIQNLLIKENVNITENPTILIASYSKNLLKIPEILITNIIEKQQKCFTIKNKKKYIINKFILISNTYKASENIIKNYQKVITARLKDIIFLLNEISNINLIKKLENLKNIIFHKKLGSLYNKAIRIKTIATYIAYNIKYNQNIIAYSALIAKADLTTKIIKNFPELHGEIGYNISKKLYLNKNISISIKEQNKPKFYKDNQPNSLSGTIISLSDKIDTIMGFYNIKLIPTGNKDPYFLKRIAMGIIEIIILQKIKISFYNIIKISFKCYKKHFDKKINKYLLFLFIKRLKYLYENKNKISNFIKNEKYISTYNQSINNIQFFQKTKRIENNIKITNRINKLIKNKKIYNNIIIIKLFKTKQEYELLTQINKIFLTKKNKKISLNDTKNYIIIKSKNFLNKIYILTENEKIKRNRITLSIKIKKILTEK